MCILLVSNASSNVSVIRWEHLNLTSFWLLVSNSLSYISAIRWEHLYLPSFWLRQDEGEATFQLALISDGLTSYALVYYTFGEMNWTYRGRWSYVIMGVSDGTVDNYQRNLYTKTERAYRIDGVSGNTGKTRSSGTRTRHRWEQQPWNSYTTQVRTVAVKLVHNTGKNSDSETRTQRR